MPTAATPKTPEWYDMQISKHCPDKGLKIRIALRIDKPQNMKHFGYFTAFIIIIVITNTIIITIIIFAITGFPQVLKVLKFILLIFQALKSPELGLRC